MLLRTPLRRGFFLYVTAAELGYLMNWRFRFLDHPALWSLRDQPRYKALIASIETNMAEQRQTLIAGTPGHQSIN